MNPTQPSAYSCREIYIEMSIMCMESINYLEHRASFKASTIQSSVVVTVP